MKHITHIFSEGSSYVEKHSINTGRGILTRNLYNALWALVPTKAPSDPAAASASDIGVQNPCGRLSQTGKGRAVHLRVNPLPARAFPAGKRIRNTTL